MIDDEKIIELLFEAFRAWLYESWTLNTEKSVTNLSYNIVNSRRDAEECVNDAYLGVWNAIPRQGRIRCCPIS